MFDHSICAQIVISATFAKGAPNYTSIPCVDSVQKDCRIYHSVPYGLMDMYGRKITPVFIVNIESVMEDKSKVLECHISQREWLKASQGHDDFVESMQQMCNKIAKYSVETNYAEGWIRHSYLGFCPEDFDPIRDIQDSIVEVKYE